MIHPLSHKHATAVAAAITIVWSCLSGCAKRDPGVLSGGIPAAPATSGSTKSSAGEYQTITVSDAATLNGTIRYAGQAPPRGRVTPNSDADICGKHEILAEDLVVSASNGVRNAVVWLEDVKQGKAWPTSEVLQDQVGCTFTPHVVAVGVNQPITFANSDPVVHNVRTFPRENLPLNLSLLAKGSGKPTTKSFLLPDEMKVSCDSHKWMGAWIIVRENPYFAVTGDDGSFSIDGIPPGSYTVVVWHESLDRIDKEIAFSAGATHTEDFVLKDR